MEPHVEEDLPDLHLGLLDGARRETVERHLADCALCRARSEEVGRVKGALATAPNMFGFAPLQAMLSSERRFEPLLPELAAFFDLPTDEVRGLLRQLDDEQAWMAAPGVASGLDVMLIAGGPKCDGAMTAFVRLGPGVEFPFHKHTGDERVLVLQGGYQDSEGVEFWRGETDVHRADTAHSFRALPHLSCIVASVLYGDSPFATEP